MFFSKVNCKDTDNLRDFPNHKNEKIGDVQKLPITDFISNILTELFGLNGIGSLTMRQCLMKPDKSNQAGKNRTDNDTEFRMIQ